MNEPFHCTWQNFQQHMRATSLVGLYSAWWWITLSLKRKRHVFSTDALSDTRQSNDTSKDHAHRVCHLPKRCLPQKPCNIKAPISSISQSHADTKCRALTRLLPRQLQVFQQIYALQPLGRGQHEPICPERTSPREKSSVHITTEGI